MSSNEVVILSSRTKSELGIDINSMTMSNNTNVYVRCTRCGEEFRREYANVYKPHACPGTAIQSDEAPVRLEVKKLVKNAVLPTRNRTTDAGYDIYAINSAEIPPHSVVNFDTGIALAAPAGYYYTVDGRSSLWSRGIMPYRGIIDGTYTGPLRVAMVNHSNMPYEVRCGDKIAQIILHHIISLDIVEIDEFSAEYNQRGVLGFGSSGR